ncbi:hypothetical protein V2I01_07425 [Micromonospora sp. BRA006-A]|nr:hypothetical protein [Micromonospora sp. BRA006-A]
MIADGTPPPRHPGETTSAPRVGDGLVRLDANGKVTYASPNAQSAYRRLGYASHLVGEDLAKLHRRLAGDRSKAPTRATPYSPRCAARHHPAGRSTPAAPPCSPGRCR